MLNESEKAELLSLARLTLHRHLSDQVMPEYRPVCPGLNAKQGAFVTLYQGLKLRGCIGQLEPADALHAVIQYCVISAALRDGRFTPVTSAEVPSLRIEISVLEPQRRVGSVDEIEIGKHGLLVARGRNRGLLLPQVAEEYGWDVPKFLSQTCLKAGLPEAAWRDPDTQIYTFEAQVISE